MSTLTKIWAGSNSTRAHESRREWNKNNSLNFVNPRPNVWFGLHEPISRIAFAWWCVVWQGEHAWYSIITVMYYVANNQSLDKKEAGNLTPNHHHHHHRHHHHPSSFHREHRAVTIFFHRSRSRTIYFASSQDMWMVLSSTSGVQGHPTNIFW